MSSPPSFVHLPSFISSSRPELCPPVGNKMIYGAGQHKVMIVGGPNVRGDYHLEEGEEIFYQIEGDMVLRIIEAGCPKDVPIPEGYMFFLPRRIPHSPQRLAGTVGLVLERERLSGESDAVIWYTPPDLKRILYREVFNCNDLGTQLKPIITRYFASEAHKTSLPAQDYESETVPILADVARRTVPAFPLRDTISKHAGAHGDNSLILCGPGAVDAAYADFEYQVTVYTGPSEYWGSGEGQEKGVGDASIEHGTVSNIGEGASSSSSSSSSSTGSGSSNSSGNSATEGAISTASTKKHQPVGPGELWLYQIEGETSISLQDGSSGGAHATSFHTAKPGDMLLLPAQATLAARFVWKETSICMLVRNSKVSP